MSMLLMWYASVIVGCDRRRPRLSDAPLHIKRDASRTEGIAISLKIKDTPIMPDNQS